MSLIGTFVTARTVRIAKDALDPSWRALDGAVDRCERFPPERRAAWKGRLAAWDMFFRAPGGTVNALLAELTAGADMDQLEIYEREAKAWEGEIVACGCALAAPRLTTHGELQAAQSAPLMWVGIGVGALAAVLLVREVTR